ncbi:hypothetical protein FNI11_13710 [Salmonella enterica subsp. salamae]|nr:hypothetical protein [Salmonella enterica subsp. salamae]ECJ2281409.1 hypothetical protein [Salmonella enterica subsp. salamae]
MGNEPYGSLESMLTELERTAPGSVTREVDGSVTLIGWHLEGVDCSDEDQHKARLLTVERVGP